MMHDLLKAKVFTLDTSKGAAFIKQLDDTTFGAFSKVITSEITNFGDPQFADYVDADVTEATHELLLIVATLCAEFDDKFVDPKGHKVRALTPALIIEMVSNAIIFAVNIDETFEYDKTKEYGETIYNMKGLSEYDKRAVHFLGRESYFKGMITEFMEMPKRIGGGVILEYFKAIGKMK